MSAKAAPSADTAELIELFRRIGLTQSKAAEAAKSPKNAATLKNIIEKNDLAAKNLDEKTAVLLASVAVASSKLAEKEREYAVDAILDGRLKSTDQVSGSWRFTAVSYTLYTSPYSGSKVSGVTSSSC